MSSQNRAETLKNEVNQKIQGLLSEFTNGLISREQFHLIYERYHGQLEMLNEILQQNRDADDLDMLDTGPTTIAIKQGTRGRAVGLAIYHHRSGILIETLGQFDVSPDVLSPILNEFSLKLEAGEFVGRRVVKARQNGWLLLAARQVTSVITLFQNEPAEQQIKEIERLHHDFEMANLHHLNGDSVDANKLAFPFLVFVNKKLRKE